MSHPDTSISVQSFSKQTWSHIVRNDRIKFPSRTPPVCVYFPCLSSVNADSTFSQLPPIQAVCLALVFLFLTLQSDRISQVPQTQSVQNSPPASPAPVCPVNGPLVTGLALADLSDSLRHLPGWLSCLSGPPLTPAISAVPSIQPSAPRLGHLKCYCLTPVFSFPDSKLESIQTPPGGRCWGTQPWSLSFLLGTFRGACTENPQPSTQGPLHSHPPYLSLNFFIGVY